MKVVVAAVGWVLTHPPRQEARVDETPTWAGRSSRSCRKKPTAATWMISPALVPGTGASNIAWWVCGYADQVRVVKPAKLAEIVAQMHRDAAGRYKN